MHLPALPVLAATLVLGHGVLPATAAEEVEHYAAASSETLAEAIENLAAYNAKVEAVMARDDLGVQDMEEVHEYTYTMEQAVARIASEVEKIAVVLERVHLSSEGDNPHALRGATEVYLEMTAPLTE
ncbi:DUF6746 family protein [Roseovarius nitratireducens]|uniref:DUF6746 family protein n=1 Tax=Roseovarius nitratireducens TaxID=2044597 RepID=UPI000CE169E3|nr:DUF6746 family protein [Roseovarius nitratireducens]